MGYAPAILGLEGPVLSAQEKAFFRELKPAGFILFARNVESPDQVRDLTRALRRAVGYEPLILIDQEGGRVQRLRPPHWRAYAPMDSFAPLFQKNAGFASRLLRLHCRMIGTDLQALGVNVNCLPLLDVPVEGSDPIIGDRALAKDPDMIAALGRIVVDSLSECGVLPVIKHIPGHGRATVDSHKSLPVVDTPLSVLKETDFKPFQALKDSALAMTAHITYSDIDPDHPATLSRIVVGRVIRMLIGFKGLLMSDDIGMQALDGTMADRAAASLKAGCNLVLHCSGDFDEMQMVAQVVAPAQSERLKTQVEGIIQPLSSARHFDRKDLEQEYDSLIKQAGLKV